MNSLGRLYSLNEGQTMDQYQTLTLLQLAMIQNALFSMGVFFLLWVAFRFAVRINGTQGTMLAKVLVSGFGLLVIWQGMLVFATRIFSLNSATKSLQSIKASGQALSVQADAFLGSPFASKASGVQFQLFSEPVSSIFWLICVVMLLTVIWKPSKTAS